MDWPAIYRNKVTTPEKAVELIKSGNRIIIGSGCAEPQVLVKALNSLAPKLRNVEIISLLTTGIADYTHKQYQGIFRHNAFFVGTNTRDAVNDGRADFTPIFLSEIPKLFKNGTLSVDVALIQVSPPDEHGFCSFGISVDIIKPAAENAKIVIAEVNDQMPRVFGDSFIHVRKLTAVVESSEPILTLLKGESSEVHRKIGSHIADLIEDGSTLQMGIGGIPDAVLSFLGNKKDLGIHTEMFSDGIIELVEKSVINNEKKTLHPGKIISSFLMGSKNLYDFVDNNPIVELHPSDYTNDPFIITQNNKMVAINSAIQIDITGQVCADTIGTKQFSGIGGQVDFIRGAARSEGGKPIIALPSTAKNGKISRIVPRFDTGTAVVTSRGDVHWVVTEYGAANLHGKSLRERAKALISIAHPDFRDLLKKEAMERKYL
ncbi:MAG: 4-hydroxybutyrate CoA-transferase [Candidatus Schekmanbacteria bacterium GWA2_38_9]|uniref:4-hydroxybutyrate CoA-transferase n=1 Tax=Candidatus Schekmanbacteria bacterium RIFCSPLOWO2_12_FULL_38_15 TaxID=1817883 RepID=A0A1F7SGT2_9BACT|nr:MAG: 4-hydroxybutyrate CoA-transferase [Candidatus Schekmanbacteria bacterium GWA2_38_9]OGL49612.1 MAG: 4-hydroxybutyrate CoA-transferase [Candidatus Schekmanbacteria bacterium RIFCSPLOWO2_02_FULL_38_14]OGL52965.1 MAG: 4-hydroxybutyrate CoA-transferase [Candidatus Schekmanbacteria bacterium RIFCSPLOWO2_12_FULL_38_15]